MYENKKKKTEKREIERNETKNIINVKITNRDNIVNNNKNKRKWAESGRGKDKKRKDEKYKRKYKLIVKSRKLSFSLTDLNV